MCVVSLMYVMYVRISWLGRRALFYVWLDNVTSLQSCVYVCVCVFCVCVFVCVCECVSVCV
jgi:hypothetical protein